MIHFRPLPMMTLWALIGIAILCGLGKWQLDRLHWKLGLIAAAESHAHAPPVPIGEIFAKQPRDAEYTHAVTEGEFIAGKRAYLFSQLEDGRIGFEVLEPMRLSDGRVLIIDRGFVPQAAEDQPAKSEPAPAGEVRISGLVRGDQKPGLFTPAPDDENKIFYVRNIPAIASAMGISGALPFMLAEDLTGPAGTYPEGGHTKLTFRNEHLQYAVTWFALALVLLVMYFVYHAKRGRLSFGAPK
ncbi:MAG: SURF1 family protein [Alphaproteobacteria bacterium]